MRSSSFLCIGYGEGTNEGCVRTLLDAMVVAMPDSIPPPKLTLEETILSILTLEQADQLTALCKRIQARAIESGTEQSVIIIFNSKGWPVHFNGTDNEKPIRPTNYQAE